VTDHDIQFTLIVINSATFIALIWYSFETMRLRRAAQDQLEALAKPCLTLWADLRNQADAILSMNQAVGNTVVRADDANFVVLNIGNGVALNVQYVFRRLDADAQRVRDDPSYLQTVLAGKNVTMPEPVNAYAGNYELIFQFESLGGVSYQSVVTLNGHVLVGFRFKRIGRNVRGFDSRTSL